MKVTTEMLPNSQAVLTIEVEPNTIQKEMEKIAREVSRHRQIPGFRKGRAPYRTIERFVGRDLLFDEAVNSLLPDLYEDAVKEADIKPFSKPEVDVIEKQPLKVKVTVDLQPVVNLGAYRDIRLTPEEWEVTDEQIAEQLEQVRQGQAEMVPVERAVTFGDFVTLDVHGTVEGETVVEQTDWELQLVEDSETPIPRFSEAIVGMEEGEEREVTLTYPEDFSNEELAGKDIDLKIELKAAKEKQVPELDDDLALDVGEYDSLEDLRASIREGLENQAKREVDQKFVDAVLDAVVVEAELEYPLSLIDERVNMSIENQKRRLSQQGYTWENYLMLTQQTEDAVREQIRPDVIKEVERSLVLGEIIRAEEIDVTEEEIDQDIEFRVSIFGPQADKMREIYQSAEMRSSIENDLLTNKAIEFLVALAKGEDLEAAKTSEVEVDDAVDEEEQAEE